YDELSRGTGLSRRQVIRAVDTMAAAGWLVVRRSRGRRPNGYQATLPNGMEAVIEARLNGDARTLLNSDTGSPSTGAPVTPATAKVGRGAAGVLPRVPARRRARRPAGVSSRPARRRRGESAVTHATFPRPRVRRRPGSHLAVVEEAALSEIRALREASPDGRA